MKRYSGISLLILLFLVSCSSAPKRIMLVTENSDLAYSQLESANTSIIEGKYDRAYTLLSSAHSLALSVDNTELLCKIVLSGVVFKISCPTFSVFLPAAGLEHTAVSKSFLAQSKEELLDYAKKLANRTDSKQSETLRHLCTIYDVRIQLENEKSASEETISAQSAKNYVALLEQAVSYIEKEPYYLAYFYRTRGDVFMASGNYDEAQKNYEESAKIHTKERYLVEIGLDWYCVARSYSLNEKKQNAIEAIKLALKYDKDAENTQGIASDYLAYSKILLKGTPSEEEKALSEELATWSEKILNSLAH